MRINKFVASVLCASAFFVSCSNRTAEQNQIKYTHTSRVDGDAYHFFQVVGTSVPYEAAYASHLSSNSSSAKEKEVASEVAKVYSALIPQLDSMATQFYVDFPIRGAKTFEADSAHDHDHSSQDSTHAHDHDHTHATSKDDSYLKHTQHEQALVIEQFKRLSQNTNRVLRDFAAKNLKTLEELYTKSGGVVEDSGHH